MTLAVTSLVQRTHVRLAIMFALALAALSVVGAVQADQAAANHAANCWTRGHYINANQLNTWNNTIGHKVVCDRNVDVHAELWRYNRSTGQWNMARNYTWNGAILSNGSWINSANPATTAPLFRGSSYMLRIYVKSVASGAWVHYDGPVVPY